MTTPLETPVYNLGDWAANVTDDEQVDWIVEAEDGWSSSPPVRATLEEKKNGDGGWGGPGFFGARVVTLAGRALAADRSSMLRAKDRIKRAGVVGLRHQVTFTVAEEHMSRTAQVRLSDQVELADQGARAFKWALTLVAADPRRYSAESFTASTVLPSVTSSGRTYPRTYPYTYGGDTEGGNGSVFVDQAGDYDETPAVITFTGPITSPQVAHVESGRMLTFALTLAEEETLVLDLGAQTALLGGTASRGGTITSGSAWFLLSPGINELQFRGAAGPGTPPVMTVTASSAWT